MRYGIRVWAVIGLTDGLFTSREPDDMRRIWSVWATSEDGEDGSEALCTWLSHTKDIEVTDTRCSEVGGAMNIEIEVKSAS
jgi:hypothetical protein